MTAAPVVYQTAFNRGELDPGLFGRNDWQSYFSGARLVRNMVCRTTGGVLKRGGLEYVVDALDQDKPSKLIRFSFSAQQVYLLEFGDFRFRVLMDGGVVVYPAGHAKAGQQVIIESPYSAEQMRKVRVAQKEDVMIFTHPDHQPRSLARMDHHVWVFDTLSFGANINPPTGLRLTLDGKNGAKYTVSAVASNNEESLPGDVVTCTQATGGTLLMPETSAMDYLTCCQWLSMNGVTIPEKYDYYRFMGERVGAFDAFAIVQGLVTRTLLSSYNNSTRRLTFYFVPGSKTSNGYNENAYEWDDPIYTAEYINFAVEYVNAGHFGTLAAIRKVIVDYVTAHNEGATATKHSALSWNAVPNAVRYRIYRSIATDTGIKFWHLGTTTQTTFDDDNILSFASSETPQVSQEPFTGPGNYPGVCAFYQQRLILARTNNQPATVWGSRVAAYRNFNKNDTGDDESTSLITETSAFEFTMDAVDVNEILWCVSMSDLLFGTAGGEFIMSGGGGLLSALNVSAARQSNYGCSPINPLVVGQAVMGVGHKNRVLRAYKWDYSGDAYGGSSVSHYANHLFHRRSIVEIAYQYEPESVVWAVMSDGTLLSCTYMNEEKVQGWTRHDTDGRFESVCNLINQDGDDELWFCVAREVNGQTRRFLERMKPIQNAGDDVADAWCVDCGLSYFGMPTTTLSGLGHLEGKTVVCLGDGNVYDDLIVSGGAVTLPVAVSKAVVGLPYTAELETMELEPMTGDSFQPTMKRPVTASILFYHTRECDYGNPEKPLEMKFVTYPGRNITPRTVRRNVSLPRPSSGEGASLWLRSASPVPFGVLSAAVQLDVGAMTPGPRKTFSDAS